MVFFWRVVVSASQVHPEATWKEDEKKSIFSPFFTELLGLHLSPDEETASCSEC